MFQFYRHYFEIPYPLPKLDIVALPVLAPNAMENWGLITFRLVHKINYIMQSYFLHGVYFIHRG